jgi:hypothetical protein
VQFAYPGMFAALWSLFYQDETRKRYLCAIALSAFTHGVKNFFCELRFVTIGKTPVGNENGETGR